VLFLEGEPARGVYVLCRGAAKVYCCDSSGRGWVLKLAQAGDLLGLPEAFLGDDVNESVCAGSQANSFDSTAEMTTAAQVDFVPVGAFRRFVDRFPEVGTRCRE